MGRPAEPASDRHGVNGGLANPYYLVKMNAVAVVPLWTTPRFRASKVSAFAGRIEWTMSYRTGGLCRV
jgi:hypothetical protein